jgi:hypothetical protein
MLGLERTADAVNARRRLEVGLLAAGRRSNDPSVGHRVALPSAAAITSADEGSVHQ